MSMDIVLKDTRCSKVVKDGEVINMTKKPKPKLGGK